MIPSFFTAQLSWPLPFTPTLYEIMLGLLWIWGSPKSLGSLMAGPRLSCIY